jgi:glycerol kinase
MQQDWRSGARAVLRVDGGMVASDWTMQFLADVLDRPVERPTISETTALGAAWLAGHKAGVWPDAEGFARLWKLERAFAPKLSASERERKYTGWRRSVAAVLEAAKDVRGEP